MTRAVGTAELDAAERVLDRVVAIVGREAEAIVRVTASDEALTRFANSIIHQNVASRSVEATVTLSLDGRVAAASTSQTDDDSLDRLVRAAAEEARLVPRDPVWPGLGPADPMPRGAWAVDRADDQTAAAPPATRAAAVRAFVDAGHDLLAAGYCDTGAVVRAIATSAGRRLVGRTSRATIDGIHQTPTSAGHGHQTSRRVADLDPVAIGVRAARTARDGAATTEIPPGRYEVVLGPECTAELCMRLGIYGFNAKLHAEGQSGIRLGDAQFDPTITLVDDVNAPDALGLPFDVEGTPTTRVELIVAGSPLHVVHDRRTAHAAGTESTGHAVPGGESFGPVPLNLCLLPGARAPADLVAGVERGLLLSSFNYCRVLDPRTLVTTGLTRNGTFLIEGGQVLGAVRNLRFTQSFLDALAPGNVQAIGSDARFANTEAGPGVVVAPSVHLASWKFTGGASG